MLSGLSGIGRKKQNYTNDGVKGTPPIKEARTVEGGDDIVLSYGSSILGDLSPDISACAASIFLLSKSLEPHGSAVLNHRRAILMAKLARF